MNAITNLPAKVSARQSMAVPDVFSDAEAFDLAQRVAKVLASSKLVPAHFQGNIADCVIALQIARRLDEEPLTVCQQLYIINGKPGWSTAYMIARANRSGSFRGRITWEEVGSGDALAVTAKATLAETGEEVRVTTDMKMATAEGWTKNTKYRTMPTHMLRWRSAAMLIRLYIPEIMLGFSTREEVETEAPMRDVTPRPKAPANLASRLDALANVPEHTDHNQETGEVIEDSSVAEPPVTGLSSEEPCTEGRTGGATPPTGAQEARKQQRPAKAAHTEEEYVAWATAWISALTDPDAGKTRWNDEKALRNRLNVEPDARDKLLDALKEKITSLTDQDESGLLAEDDKALSTAAKRGTRALDEAIAAIPESRRATHEMAIARRHRHNAAEADAAIAGGGTR